MDFTVYNRIDFNKLYEIFKKPRLKKGKVSSKGSELFSLKNGIHKEFKKLLKFTTGGVHKRRHQFFGILIPSPLCCHFY